MLSPLTTLVRTIDATIGLPEETSRIPPVTAAVVGTIALATLLGIGVAVDAAGDVAIGLVLGIVLAVAIAFAASDRPVTIVAGTGLLLVAAPLFVYVPVYRFFDLGRPLSSVVVVSGALVGYGIVRFRFDAFGTRVGYVALGQLFGAIAAASLVTVGLVFTRVETVSAVFGEAVPSVGDAIDALLVPSPSEAALVEFSALLALAVVAVWLALAALPIVQLVPGRHETAVSDALDIVDNVLGATFALCVLTFVVSLAALGNVNRLEAVYYDLSPTLHAVLSTVVESSLLRLLLVQVILVSFVVAVAVELLAAVGTRRLDDAPSRIVPAILWGLLFVVAIAVAAPSVLESVAGSLEPAQERALTTATEEFGPVVVGLLAGVVGLWFAGVALLAIPAASGLGFVPDRTAGVRLVMGGTFLATVAGAVGGIGTVVLVGGIVATMVIWDVGEFGLGLTEELGRSAPTRHGELVHVAGSVVVGGLLFAGTIATAGFLAGTTLEGALVLPALVFATVAAVALTIAIRG
ncbi:hypothetical protein OB955_06795 [Halobacteria archaeon AArc-m2/3/4]|uniref:Uncharacterized protein n=1 Tax=Natronoglomus mannanivorans TaxID=2979990 RepID=A0ABT2QC07_9EURY|nr:hypothetical protein [Halobacteria archaeon AArc-m2/3/4]